MVPIQIRNATIKPDQDFSGLLHRVTSRSYFLHLVPLGIVERASHRTKRTDFLTLFGYVSRAHEIEIRPSVASIICEVIAWILFKF